MSWAKCHRKNVLFKVSIWDGTAQFSVSH